MLSHSLIFFRQEKGCDIKILCSKSVGVWQRLVLNTSLMINAQPFESMFEGAIAKKTSICYFQVLT